LVHEEYTSDYYYELYFKDLLRHNARKNIEVYTPELKYLKRENFYFLLENKNVKIFKMDRFQLIKSCNGKKNKKIKNSLVLEFR
jgi:hypothetical protein